MDFGLSLVLSIVKIADKAGVFNYFKKIPEKSATALYKRLLEDKDFKSEYLKNFFDTEIDKIFNYAFEKIAPKNESLKRKFILAVLTEPDIVQTLDNLEKGNLPKAQILIPVFKKVLPGKNPAEISDKFLNVLKDKLSDDHKSSFRVLLNLPEQISEEHEKTREVIRNLLKVHPISPPEKQEFKIYLSKLPTTGHDLFGRKKELKMLDRAWADSQTNIFSLVAWGGVGKSALVNAWLNSMAKKNYRGAERVYGWSFYSQGTKEERQVSADEFFADALEWFGYKGDPILSPWDKGKKLAELVRAHRTLLILDGMEPLQSTHDFEEGKIKDPALSILVIRLAKSRLMRDHHS